VDDGDDVKSSTEDSNNPGGEILARLLAETVETINSEVMGISKQQATLLARYADKDGRGRDVRMVEDGLNNPLAFYPTDPEAALNSNVSVLRPYYRSLPKLNTYYRVQCDGLERNGKTSRSATFGASTSREWVDQYGERVASSRWCRPHNPSSLEDVPSLKRIMMLKSEKDSSVSSGAPVSIVTQLSLERTMMLEQQCSYWPYKIAAVVYIPLVRGKIFTPQSQEWHNSPLDKAVEELEAFHARMSTLDSGCLLDMEVVVEECCTKELASMYPTNAVRNRALLLATTPAVLLLDADFIVDLSLVNTLKSRSKTKQLLEIMENKTAIVLPAFEAWDQGNWGRTVALDAVRKGKSYIAAKFMYNVVIGFHMSHYPQGHEKTNFWRWVNTTEAYQVEYQLGFEPYIMMLKRYVPYYDERFRGYYWNKVQHLMHLSLQHQISFLVHPETFVVHIPHRKPKTKWRTKRSGQKEKNHGMFLEALQDMKRRKFVPVTSFPHLCLPFDVLEAVASMFRNGTYKSAFLRMAEEVKEFIGNETSYALRKDDSNAFDVAIGSRGEGVVRLRPQELS
jgi:hypothetical protein